MSSWRHNAEKKTSVPSRKERDAKVKAIPNGPARNSSMRLGRR
jgi:hypothetical protein